MNHPSSSMLWKKIITLFFFCVLQLCTSLKFSKDVLTHLMNAASDDAITFAGSTIPVNELYNSYPACMSLCDAQKPCAANEDTTSKVCSPSLSYVDTSHQLSPKDITYPYCNIGTICCHPELCRPRVLQCSYNYAKLLQQMNNHFSEETSELLNEYANLADDDTINDFLGLVEPDSSHDKACNANCNGWVYGNSPGDLSDATCSSMCVCSNVYQAQLAPGGDYICIRNPPSSPLGYPTYQLPYPDIKDDSNSLKVCPIGYTCTDPAQCEDFEVYRAKYPDRPIPKSPNMCIKNSSINTNFPIYSSGDTGVLDGELRVCPQEYTCLDSQQCENYETYEAKERAKAIENQKNIQKADPGFTNSKSSISVGVIVGIVVACVGGLAVVVIAVYFVRKRKSKEAHHHDDVGDNYTPIY